MTEVLTGPRSVWRREDDFTRWLSAPENLPLLSAVVGVPLRTESLQRSVGSLRSDLVCVYGVDGSVRRAVVEAQFTRSDHDHLSKLQFYGGGIPESELLVWIAPEFRPEHLRTLELLNQRIADWRLVPVRLEISADGGVGLSLATVESSTASQRRRPDSRPGRVQPLRRSVDPADYGEPEQIAFITRFIAHLYRTRSPLAKENEVWPSAPSEKPPFAQRNLRVSSVKLKGKILPRDPYDLQAEVLLRRSFVRGDDDEYDRIVNL